MFLVLVLLMSRDGIIIIGRNGRRRRLIQAFGVEVGLVRLCGRAVERVLPAIVALGLFQQSAEVCTKVHSNVQSWLTQRKVEKYSMFNINDLHTWQPACMSI